MTEIAVRLRPTYATLRYLLAHSGNECAFPGCERVLVNDKGQWVGEVCHIEAAMPGGERFNAAMSNEERRQRANLMLMCHEHHVETNDVTAFEVARLQEIKVAHEQQYTGGGTPLADDKLEQAVNDIISASIEDVTERVELHLPQTLAAFNEVLRYQLSADELAGSIATLAPALEALRRIPVDTRAVFAIAVDRSRPGTVALPLHEMENATGATGADLYLHVVTLEDYRIAYLDDDERGEEQPPIPTVYARDIDGWAFWNDFSYFCDEKGLAPKEVINELRFDVLD